MARKLIVDDVARYPRPGMAVPGQVRFSPDGRLVTYVANREGSLVQQLWGYEIESGRRFELLGAGEEGTRKYSREEELRRERSRTRETGITDYSYAREAKPPVLMVRTVDGLMVRKGDGEFLVLPGSQGNIAPQLSRDGTHVAYVRDGELQVQDTAGGEARTLTQGAGAHIRNGLAEFVAQEEMDRAEGFWWSRDGRFIAYERVDTSDIPVYPIVHQGKDEVEIEEHAYPFAGAKNARVQLGVVSVGGGETTWIDLGADPDIYLARVYWDQDGALLAEVESRDQKTLKLLRFDLEARTPEGAGGAATVITERVEPWINLSNDTRFLKSGQIVRSSEESGFRHLYLHEAGGRRIRRITGGEWVVTRVVAVDEGERVVYFEGTHDSVLERHLYAAGLDGPEDGEPRRLTEEAGWHETEVSPDFRYFTDRWSSLERPPSVVLRNIDGTRAGAISEQPDLTPEALGFQPPELVTGTTRDGVTLNMALYKPPEIEQGRRYPLVVAVYGGPHAQTVGNTWGLTVDMRAQYLAQHGFVVLKADNRGSANRGIEFEGAIAGKMGEIEVRDQVDAVRTIAQREYVDGERVGIYGWSYGGYMTLMAMVRAPEVFKVGVAGAPVTHWDGYDTHYTERYMGLPQTNPEGYEQSAVMPHVANLRGKLLLVHGMIDENVHFRHTARLMKALADEQKLYDVLLFPDERHMPRDTQGLVYQERRVLSYFEQNL